MEYGLDIRRNALDSLKEALIRFDEGENGRAEALKYAVLHIAHFAELSLKMYLESLQPELVFNACINVIDKRAKRDRTDLLCAYRALKNEGQDFSEILNVGNKKGTRAKEEPKAVSYLRQKPRRLHTVPALVALDMALGERCRVTRVPLVDQALSDDLQWAFELRNEIMHYQFRLGVVETRLAVGRVLRGMIEFHEIFDLLDIDNEVDETTKAKIDQVAGEFEHKVEIASEEVERAREKAYNVSPKERMWVEWEALECPECQQWFLIPNPDSETGWRCTLCENEYSDFIPYACDICGERWPNEMLTNLDHEDGTCSSICPQCSGDER